MALFNNIIHSYYSYLIGDFIYILLVYLFLYLVQMYFIKFFSPLYRWKLHGSISIFFLSFVSLTFNSSTTLFSILYQNVSIQSFMLKNRAKLGKQQITQKITHLETYEAETSWLLQHFVQGHIVAKEDNINTNFYSWVEYKIWIKTKMTHIFE